MKDQVSGLQKKDVKAAMLCDETEVSEVEKMSPCTISQYFTDIKQIKKQLKMGHPEIRLLYLTPESLFSKKYKEALWMAYKQEQLRRLVVDEVSSFAQGLSNIQY